MKAAHFFLVVTALLSVAASSGRALSPLAVAGGDWQASAIQTGGPVHDLTSANFESRGPGKELGFGADEHRLETLAAGSLSETSASSLMITLSGTLGLADWYVSAVTASATISDAISGSALIEYRLDSGDWQIGDQLSVSADGPHTVDFRATDLTGLQTTDTKSFNIDQTPPISGFISPIEGSTGAIAQGLFTLEGQSTDTTSGLAAVQISTDDGANWLDLSASPSGDWRIPWDTQPFPNGLYPVLARAQDLAGNLGSPARVTLLLANQPPRVRIQESWWVWEAGKLSVRERFLPVTEIRVRITCLDGQPDLKLNFTPENLPSALSWDRKCGQGQFATSGDHLVTLIACDKVGNCARATGTIKVPFVETHLPTLRPTQDNTVTPICEPTQTATPEPTAWPTAQPTAQAQPTLAPDPTTSAPAAPQSRPAWLVWSLTVFLVLLLGLGCVAMLDPRPRALSRLGKILAKLARDE